MSQAPTLKSHTANIVISEPDEDLLKTSLQGREVSPELAVFLKNLMRTKKWTRKITLPSTHSDVAVALVFSSSLKESGLEIISELHIFLAGHIIVEQWQVVGETQKPSSLPKEAFISVSIQKVLVEGGKVHVELSAPLPGGQTKTILKSFDFGIVGPKVRQVPHPLLG